MWTQFILQGLKEIFIIPHKQSDTSRELTTAVVGKHLTVTQALVGGPMSERRAGSATREWKRPIETSSTITWESRSLFSSKHYTLKKVRMKAKWVSANTTTERKVEKPPWKTWGPVLIELLF